MLVTLMGGWRVRFEVGERVGGRRRRGGEGGEGELRLALG